MIAEEPETGSTPQRSIEILPVEVGPIRLALAAESAREILGAVAFVPVPVASALVPGVMPWRGRAVAVLDVGVALEGVPRLERSAPRPRAVVAVTAYGLVALPVDAVREVRTVAADQIRPARVTRGTADEVALGDAWVPLLDLERLLAPHIPAEERT